VGYTLVDRKWNEEMNELQIPQIIYRVIQMKLEHERMTCEYQPKGKKKFGET
jgi:hypothetical protein